jgi:hypothetical protein
MARRVMAMLRALHIDVKLERVTYITFCILPYEGVVLRRNMRPLYLFNAERSCRPVLRSTLKSVTEE